MKVGVIVGRFQVAEIHEGHRYLIGTSMDRHEKTIVFLGVPRFEGTIRDPLDYHTRAKMIEAEFPGAITLPIVDQHSDEKWSQELDKAIRSVVPRVEEVFLYGGRDSFLKQYNGEWVNKVEVDPIEPYLSGTQVRASIARNPRYSADFRAGQIYYTQHMPSKVLPTVDIAVLQSAYKKGEVTQIVLGKKPGEKQWRLPGGFVDPEDQNLHSAAYREFTEEVPGVDLDGSGALNLIGSHRVDDPRFVNTGITIMTSLFVGDKAWGSPRGGDDLEVAAWFDLSSAEKEVVDWHKPLIRMVKEYLSKK